MTLQVERTFTGRYSHRIPNYTISVPNIDAKIEALLKDKSQYLNRWQEELLAYLDADVATTQAHDDTPTALTADTLRTAMRMLKASDLHQDRRRTEYDLLWKTMTWANRYGTSWRMAGKPLTGLQGNTFIIDDPLAHQPQGYGPCTIPAHGSAPVIEL